MSDTTTPPEMYGHTSQIADVTTTENEALNIMLLIEHDFITGLEEGKIENAAKTYREFTKIVAQLYHGKHTPQEIRTALVLAEDHLTVILDDEEIECAISFKYAEKALEFIKRFLNYYGEEAEVEIPVSEDKPMPSKKSVKVFGWKLGFTDLVELLDSLIEMEAIDIPERARKDFINAIFKLFGVNKTVADFNRARHKLAEKILDDPKTTNKKNPKLIRGTFLPKLHKNLEQAWQIRYNSNNREPRTR